MAGMIDSALLRTRKVMCVLWFNRDSSSAGHANSYSPGTDYIAYVKKVGLSKLLSVGDAYSFLPLR